jgi:hypothetical protein
MKRTTLETSIDKHRDLNPCFLGTKKCTLEDAAIELMEECIHRHIESDQALAISSLT